MGPFLQSSPPPSPPGGNDTEGEGLKKSGQTVRFWRITVVLQFFFSGDLQTWRPGDPGACAWFAHRTPVFCGDMRERKLGVASGRAVVVSGLRTTMPCVLAVAAENRRERERNRVMDRGVLCLVMGGFLLSRHRGPGRPAGWWSRVVSGSVPRGVLSMWAAGAPSVIVIVCLRAMLAPPGVAYKSPSALPLHPMTRTWRQASWHADRYRSDTTSLASSRVTPHRRASYNSLYHLYHPPNLSL